MTRQLLTHRDERGEVGLQHALRHDLDAPEQIGDGLLDGILLPLQPCQPRHQACGAALRPEPPAELLQAAVHLP